MLQVQVPRWYRVYTLVVLAVAAVLIWWGAAVTTEHVGLAVPDWPKSFGKFNPDGWWAHAPVRLEHGHRLLAALVGVLTLGLCAGAWCATRDQVLRGATAFAVLLVILQGILGGMRVLRVSDEFGIVHGCLAQSFFCLLVFVVLAAHQWAGPRPVVITERKQALLRAATVVLFAAVFLQLVLGAVLRHTQRYHLADHGLLLTGEGWFPGFGRPDMLVLFLHKWWAMVVVVLSSWVIAGPLRALGAHRLAGTAGRLFLGAIVVQVALGAAVILTRKTFWVTNFHVINGQLLLTCAFVLLICAWRSRPNPNLSRS